MKKVHTNPALCGVALVCLSLLNKFITGNCPVATVFIAARVIGLLLLLWHFIQLTNKKYPVLISTPFMGVVGVLLTIFSVSMQYVFNCFLHSQDTQPNLTGIMMHFFPMVIAVIGYGMVGLTLSEISSSVMGIFGGFAVAASYATDAYILIYTFRSDFDRLSLVGFIDLFGDIIEVVGWIALLVFFAFYYKSSVSEDWLV